MSLEQSVDWRHNAILQGKCPACGKIKEGKDLDRYRCFSCRVLRANKAREDYNANSRRTDGNGNDSNGQKVG